MPCVCSCAYVRVFPAGLAVQNVVASPILVRLLCKYPSRIGGMIFTCLLLTTLCPHLRVTYLLLSCTFVPFKNKIRVSRAELSIEFVVGLWARARTKQGLPHLAEISSDIKPSFFELAYFNHLASSQCLRRSGGTRIACRRASAPCCCCCCCFLTLTDPLRIQPWSQDKRNQTKSNRESEMSMESIQRRTDKK